MLRTNCTSLLQAKRDMERDMLEYQSKMADPETEKKLRKQLKKVKALYQDTAEQLEHEREMRSNSAMVKSLRNQLEDLQASEGTAMKSQKRLQVEVDELQVQNDELSRTKMEVCNFFFDALYSKHSYSLEVGGGGLYQWTEHQLDRKDMFFRII